MTTLFITPQRLKKQVLKIWQRGDIHRAWLQGLDCFPIQLPLKNIAAKTLLADFAEIQEAIDALRRDSQKNGYLITDKAISHRQLGEQKIPHFVVFQNEVVFLTYLTKTAEFSQFKRLTEQSLQQDALLLDWLIRYPFKVMQYAEVWLKLLKVCRYFEKQPKPDCYIRQLDIKAVDSKFIEQHKSILNELLTQTLADKDYDSTVTGLRQHGFERRYGLRYDQPLIRFRLLDDALAISGITDITLTLSEFKKIEIAVDTVFIAENKVNGLAFPSYPGAIVIFGLGYAVNLLADVNCLQGKKLYYWGDIDVDGMAILSRLRHYYPQIKSLMMDQKTLDQFLDLAEKVTENSAEKVLRCLTEDESCLLRQLQKKSLRLEQERISFGYWLKCLQALTEDNSVCNEVELTEKERN